MTKGVAEGRQTKTSKEANNAGLEVDQKVRAVLANNSQELLNGPGKVLEEIADATGSLDDLANSATNTGETETGDQLSDLRAELDEKLLGVFAGDLKDILGHGGSILEEAILVGALQVLTKSTHNFTQGVAQGGKTQAGDETSDFGVQLDQDGTEILVDNGDQAVDNFTDVLEEIADGTSGLDDFAGGDADAGKTQTREQVADLRAELDKQFLGVLAGNGQDLVGAVANVLEKVAVIGDAAGRDNGARRDDGAGGDDDVGGGGGDGRDRDGRDRVEGLGDGGQSTGRGGDGRASQGGESDERRLHVGCMEKRFFVLNERTDSRRIE